MLVNLHLTWRVTLARQGCALRKWCLTFTGRLCVWRSQSGYGDIKYEGEGMQMKWPSFIEWCFSICSVLLLLTCPRGQGMKWRSCHFLLLYRQAIYEWLWLVEYILLYIWSMYKWNSRIYLTTKISMLHILKYAHFMSNLLQIICKLLNVYYRLLKVTVT